MLTSYSSIANFFGPLQSGPGLRAVYLKTVHHVRLRDYTLVSLVGLGLFASMSAGALLAGTRPWWQTSIALLIVASGCFVVIRYFRRRDKQPSDSQLSFRPQLIVSLIGLVFLQVLLTIGWYWVEIHAVNPAISFRQAVSYAGAANFSLFVSVTPDAIGIREAFLVASSHIHHVPTATIVSANVIDRAVYIVFLGLLFIGVGTLHVSDKLGLRKLRRQAAAADQL